jgi:hypothetical protein
MSAGAITATPSRAAAHPMSTPITPISTPASASSESPVSAVSTPAAAVPAAPQSAPRHLRPQSRRLQSPPRCAQLLRSVSPHQPQMRRQAVLQPPSLCRSAQPRSPQSHLGAPLQPPQLSCKPRSHPPPPPPLPSRACPLQLPLLRRVAQLFALPLLRALTLRSPPSSSSRPCAP